MIRMIIVGAAFGLALATGALAQDTCPQKQQLDWVKAQMPEISKVSPDAEFKVYDDQDSAKIIAWVNKQDGGQDYSEKTVAVILRRSDGFAVVGFANDGCVQQVVSVPIAAYDVMYAQVFGSGM